MQIEEPHIEPRIRSARSNDEYSFALFIQLLIRGVIVVVMALVFTISARKQGLETSFTIVITLIVVAYITLEIIVYLGKLKISSILEFTRLEAGLNKMQRREGSLGINAEVRDVSSTLNPQVGTERRR
jgi:hypothetical protein